MVDDALPADNRRYFTVEVRPPRKLLLLVGRQRDATFLREALGSTGEVDANGEAEPRRGEGVEEDSLSTSDADDAPNLSGAEEVQKRRDGDDAPPSTAGVARKFDCHVVLADSAQDYVFSEYSAVLLVDLAALSEPAWQSLIDFVQQGGGVGIFLGRHAQIDDWNGATPQQLVAGELRWQSRDATYLQPGDYSHPLLSRLADHRDVVPWAAYPVFKYWELANMAGDAHVVAPFANRAPAILERIIGQGRVLTMTTPVSDEAHADPWNLLPTGPDPWPFVALAEGIASYLADGGDAGAQGSNYLAGQTATLRLSPAEMSDAYVLHFPDGQSVPRTLPPDSDDIVIGDAMQLGNYSIRAGGEQGALDRGFSINAPEEVSQLERADVNNIVSTLGSHRVKVARSRHEIELRTHQGRVGHELFGWLISAMALTLGAEHLLANRFYRKS
jgi:hypothetical protein